MAVRKISLSLGAHAVYIYMCVYTYIHTYIHTHVYIYIHTFLKNRAKSGFAQ